MPYYMHIEKNSIEIRELGRRETIAKKLWKKFVHIFVYTHFNEYIYVLYKYKYYVYIYIYIYLYI